MRFIEGLALAVTGTHFQEHNFPVTTWGSDSIDIDDWKFRALTKETRRDLPQRTEEQLKEQAAFLYIQNGLTKRLTDLVKDFTIGKGINYECENDKVREVLENFWTINKLEVRQHWFILSLGLLGELFNPVFTNNVNGDVKIGYIDPIDVGKVITEKENILESIAVKQRSKDGVTEPRVWKIVKPQELKKGDSVDNIIIHQFKPLPNMTRGAPELASVFDYMHAFDDLLFGEVERVKFLKSFVEDIEVQGADEAEIKQLKDLYGTDINFGRRFWHNEKMTRQFLSPDIKADDLTKFLKMVLAICLGCAGVPEHFFALAYDINAATANTMEPPLIRRIETRQKYIVEWYRNHFDYAITQAAIFGKMTTAGQMTTSDLKKDAYDYRINFPDPSDKSIKDTAQSVVQLANALVVAENQGWVSHQKAAEIFAILGQEFGVEINFQDEIDTIEAENMDEAGADYALQELKDMLGWYKTTDNKSLKESVRVAVIEEFKRNGR